MGFWDIKTLSNYLTIKPSTLYAWVAQGKIPHIKIHRLIRFRPADIEAWISAFQGKGTKGQHPLFAMPRNAANREIDALIARAKQEVYDAPHGESRPTSAHRKEDRSGAG